MPRLATALRMGPSAATSLRRLQRQRRADRRCAHAGASTFSSFDARLADRARKAYRDALTRRGVLRPPGVFSLPECHRCSTHPPGDLSCDAAGWLHGGHAHVGLLSVGTVAPGLSTSFSLATVYAPGSDCSCDSFRDTASGSSVLAADLARSLTKDLLRNLELTDVRHVVSATVPVSNG